VLDLAFRPDRDRSEPLYRQLGGYLRGLIASERLPRGGKLPATRELATALGLSRNTVSQAYDELLAEGILTAHVGQGTFVAPQVGAARLRVVPEPPSRTRGFVWSGLFAHRARALALPGGARAVYPAGPHRFDFRGGQVAGDCLPGDDLKRAVAEALRRHLKDLARLLDPLGWLPLRQEVARYLVGRGVECTPAEVAIVNGAQQAIDLVARVLVDPGDTIVMEQPGYFGASLAFTACQANVVGVGVDDEGLRTDELARILRTRRAKLVYATPAAQSPTGAVLSDARRRVLLALADEHQVPILEDDYDSELRYEGAVVAPLKCADEAGQVIYAATFSKVLFPGLRVGYVVAAPQLLEKLALARWNADVTTSAPVQAALAILLARGGLERHLRRVRRLYAARLGAMLDALGRTMPAGTTWTRPRGGHLVWLTLPRGTDDDGVYRDALRAGIAYTPGELFHLDGRGRHQLALSFANLPPATIAEGIAVLAGLVRRHQARAERRSS
jgi:GntR family transcriptional regulator/MocR family aminotransferase